MINRDYPVQVKLHRTVHFSGRYFSGRLLAVSGVTALCFLCLIASEKNHPKIIWWRVTKTPEDWAGSFLWADAGGFALAFGTGETTFAPWLPSASKDPKLKSLVCWMDVEREIMIRFNFSCHVNIFPKVKSWLDSIFHIMSSFPQKYN